MGAQSSLQLHASSTQTQTHFSKLVVSVSVALTQIARCRLSAAVSTVSACPRCNQQIPKDVRICTHQDQCMCSTALNKINARAQLHSTRSMHVLNSTQQDPYTCSTPANKINARAQLHSTKSMHVLNCTQEDQSMCQTALDKISPSSQLHSTRSVPVGIRYAVRQLHSNDSPIMSPTIHTWKGGWGGVEVKGKPN